MGAGKRTLAVDIGGTWVKALILDPRGRAVGEPRRCPTPRPATVSALSSVLRDLARDAAKYDRVSLGFPGVVVRGVARTAVHLHPSWIGVVLASRLRPVFRAPIRVANDADIQGLGLIEGRGVELVLTLGTGIGSSLFHEGRLIPNLEMGHHPFEQGSTYEQLLGDAALERSGQRRWKATLVRAVLTLQHAFNPRVIHLGGGNARLVRRGMPPGVRVADNVAGLLGGIRLWNR